MPPKKGKKGKSDKKKPAEKPEPVRPSDKELILQAE
jgi:hypothetical protein